MPIDSTGSNSLAGEVAKNPIDTLSRGPQIFKVDHKLPRQVWFESSLAGPYVRKNDSMSDDHFARE